MKRRLSTVMLSTAFAVYVGIAAGCGGGSSDSVAAANAGAQKPSTAAKGNNGNSGGKRGSTVVNGGLTLHVGGDAPSVNKSSVYIVQLKDDPAVALEHKGRYNPNSAAARKYVQELQSKQDRLLNKVGAASGKLYNYVHSFNGFAATLSGAQAVAIAKDPEVERMWSDEVRQLQTNYSPEFLGLPDPNGPWDTGVTGEDVIIGVIDTGIWPDHPSFSDAGDTDYNNYGPPPAHWRGLCQSGEQWSQQTCNNKLIGARYFPYGIGANRFRGKARNYIFPQGYNSTRDDDGHGSHTSSTAGGNRDVMMTLAGVPVLGDSEGSGIAPRARIAHYKACWNGDDPVLGGCWTSDTVAAIDAAVQDGVDVINYSIGGSSTNILAPDDVAFLFAADAGVYVATSNGNSGPEPATTGTPAADPWVISVGAATRDGTTTRNAIEVTEPESVSGNYLAQEGSGPPMVVYGGAEGYLAKPADAANFEGCNPWSNSAAGHIALVSRGSCFFADKVANAQTAGAAGVIVYNNQPGLIVMGGLEGSSVPSVMIENSAGTLLAGTMDGGEEVYVVLAADVFLAEQSVGNVMAGFSSRGPNLGAINIIKPDVTAPGVDILAAITPTPLPQGVHQNTGELFGYKSGTSMSSPHVAGTLALVKQAHPDWTPGMAKSAVMTTARQNVLKEDGATDADPFDMGSGYIQPGNALDPGLVYDAGFLDYLAYLCGAVPGSVGPATCEFLEANGFSLDPTQLNYPSIGVAEFVGVKTIHRTVTSVAPGTVEYCASIEAPPGVDVSVDEDCFEISEGETHTYALMLTATESIETGNFLFGSITWSDGAHDVYSPIAVRAKGIAAPAEVFGGGTEGQIAFDVSFGFSGEYTAGVHGLNPATEIPGTVADDPNNSYDPFSGVGIAQFVWIYPEGTAFSRWQLRDDYTDGNDDLDLYVWECDAETLSCSLVGSSGSPTSTETVDLLLPKPGTDIGEPGTIYVVEVHGWQTDGPDANFTLFEWEFGLDDDAGNMTVDPTMVDAVPGATQTLTVDYFGLDAGAKYLGAISHSSPGGLEGLTLINVE